jgi:hypothetical protein
MSRIFSAIATFSGEHGPDCPEDHAGSKQDQWDVS